MTKKNENKIKNGEELIEKQGEFEEIEENSELEQLKLRVEQAENSHRRALADYQNLQKRVSDQRSELILSANRDLLLRILSVLDTLVLANQHVENEGLKVAINQFMDVLKAEGVSRIDTVGHDFNPHLMEAVAIESGEENKVLDELRAGFMLNDKVLRPAQVKVGKKD
jgi:molecular chaperone GrpE